MNIFENSHYQKTASVKIINSQLKSEVMNNGGYTVNIANVVYTVKRSPSEHNHVAVK